MYGSGTGNGGSFDEVQPRDRRHPAWIEGVTGNVENVVVIDGIAYAGGHFEAQPRPDPREQLLHPGREPEPPDGG